MARRFTRSLPVLQIHPLSDQFPSISGSAFEKLKRDIKARGQRRPIALYEGMVWDGRARLSACEELGLNPLIRVLKSKDLPIHYLIKRHDRYGEPHSPERETALKILWQI